MNTINSGNKFIHLLYAPTNFCNMACQYCYLGTGTDENTNTKAALNTLVTTVDKFLEAGVTPFNLSFHGGEVTAIPRQLLENLFAFTKQYYSTHGPKIKQAGFALNPLHIKTNLYNFDRLYSLFDAYQVSISGSVDLPLSLHAKYRLDKKGRSTLKKITANLKLLAHYPHHKKISCVVTREHLAHLDAFIHDIKYLHYDIGLDMSKFNIMFSFDSHKNQEKYNGTIAGTEMLNSDEQLILYHALKKAFIGTELEAGFKQHWFKEFTPEFCCSAINCGDKFFLLQSNGDVYACPRGQSSKSFFYGNVFSSSVTQVMSNGWKTIEALENQKPGNAECYQCNYLPYCNQGCVFVRDETKLTKSYTCELQKQIYRDQADKYPAYKDDYIKSYALKYRFANNINAIKAIDITEQQEHVVTPELGQADNALSNIINSDTILQQIYSSSNFALIADDTLYALSSPIISNSRQLIPLSIDSKIELKVHKDVFNINCNEPVTNNLQLMLLRNTMVNYGDEGRSKQEHLVDYSVYSHTFFKLCGAVKNEYYHFDLASFVKQHQNLFLPDIRNNLFITTKTMRDYHYQKQKKNAFYHIQAINLPFSYFEFYWL